MTASILPNAKNQFISGAGIPLAGGKVYFYIPNTSTPKNTWQDAGETILNTNPIILDASGEALIYGTGQYRQVVYDANGNIIWDALTQDVTQAIQSSVALFCGTSTGTANAQVVSPSPSVTAVTTGQQFSFFAGFTNTGAMYINISALTFHLYFAGVDLVGNEVQAGAAILIQFDGTNMELVNPYPLPIPGASGNLLQSTGTKWASAAPLLPAPGTAGDVLTSTGTVWQNENLSTLLDAVFGNTEGNLLQRGSVLWQVLADGSSGQSLISGGSAALNSWGTPLMTPLGIGSIIMAQCSNATAAGSTAAAATLTAYGFNTNFDGGAAHPPVATGDVLAGTWKALMTQPALASTNDAVILWQRIA